MRTNTASDTLSVGGPNAAMSAEFLQQQFLAMAAEDDKKKSKKLEKDKKVRYRSRIPRLGGGGGGGGDSRYRDDMGSLTCGVAMCRKSKSNKKRMPSAKEPPVPAAQLLARPQQPKARSLACRSKTVSRVMVVRFHQ